MTRPLKNHSIDELEDLLKPSDGNISVLNELANELKNRTTVREKALAEKVVKAQQKVFSSLTVERNDAGLAKQTTQKTLWDASVSEGITEKQGIVLDERHAPTVAVTEEKATTIKIVIVPTPHRHELTLEESYKELKVSPSAQWDTIEEARRGIVQMVHPIRMADLDENLQKEAAINAMRANVASEVIFAERLKSERRSTARISKTQEAS
jgi:hypothetical protein